MIIGSTRSICARTVLSATLASFVLLASACGGSDSEGASAEETVEETTTSTEATTTTEAVTTTTKVADDGMTSEEQEALDALEDLDLENLEDLEDLLDDDGLSAMLTLIFGADFDPDGQIAGCLSEKGIDGSGLLGADEQAAQAAALGILFCAPEQAAKLAVEGSLIEGIDEADQLCAITEFYRYFGEREDEITPDMLEGDVPPEQFRDGAVDRATDSCDISSGDAGRIWDGF